MEPKRLFIILPGFTMDNKGMELLVTKLKAYYPKAKYIIMNPPIRKITIYKQKKYRAWYDYYTNYCDKEDCINNDQLLESRKRIQERILKESKHIDLKHTYLIGYSQGACMALDAGLTFTKQLGGIISIKGHVPKKTFEYPLYKQKLLASNGVADKTVGYNFAIKSYHKLKQQKYDILLIKQTTNHSLKTGLNELVECVNIFVK